MSRLELGFLSGHQKLPAMFCLRCWLGTAPRQGCSPLTPRGARGGLSLLLTPLLFQRRIPLIRFPGCFGEIFPSLLLLVFLEPPTPVTPPPAPFGLPPGSARGGQDTTPRGPAETTGGGEIPSGCRVRWRRAPQFSLGFQPHSTGGAEGASPEPPCGAETWELRLRASAGGSGRCSHPAAAEPGIRGGDCGGGRGINLQFLRRRGRVALLGAQSRRAGVNRGRK